MSIYVERLALSHFEARNVEKITGATVSRQKSWRNRGVTKGLSEAGRARVTFDDVCYIALVSFLSDRNISLEIATSIADGVLDDLINFAESLPEITAWGSRVRTH